MPTYEYACRKCGDHLEVVQSFKDDALTTCPTCAGELRKVFGTVGIVFKGSGFYKTDSRSSTKSTSDTRSDKGEKSDKGETKSEPAKTESTKSESASTSSESKSDTKKTDNKKSDKKPAAAAS